LTEVTNNQGVLAALGGVVSIGRSGICNGANAIQPYDTDAIAACIIGGAEPGAWSCYHRRGSPRRYA
jgi:predicted ABC-type sugar transport system permease subunit